MHADGGGGGGECEGRSARTGCLAPRCGLGFWAAVSPPRRPPGMKYCTRGRRGGAGTPSWSLRFPRSRQEGEEGFLVRKTGAGVGVRAPTNTRFPGT